jgi:hypothetical protein
MEELRKYMKQLRRVSARPIIEREPPQCRSEASPLEKIRSVICLKQAGKTIYNTSMDNPASVLAFEPRISRIRSKSTNYWASTLDLVVSF